MGLQPFYGKGPCHLMRAGSWTTRVQTSGHGTHKCLNYWVIFIVHA